MNEHRSGSDTRPAASGPLRRRIRHWLAAWLLPALVAPALAMAGGSSEVLLDAHFDDKPVNQPIGTGGAAAGEPVWHHSQLQAIVRQDPADPANRLLELSGTALLASAIANFHFIDAVEVNHGQLLVSVELTFPTADFSRAALLLREQGGGAANFTSLYFTPGTMAFQDGAGTAAPGRPFTLGEPLRIDILHDLDTGRYDVLVDGVAHVQNRLHGVTGRGIGTVRLGVMPYGEHRDALFLADNLLVGHIRDDNIFADGFDTPR